MRYNLSRHFSFIFLCMLAWVLLFFLYRSVTGISLDLTFGFFVFYAFGLACEFAIVFFLLTAFFSRYSGLVHALICIIPAFIITSLLVADFLVYRLFRLHIDMAMLTMFFGPGSDDIFVFPAIMYVKAAAIFGAIFCLLLLFWWLSGKIGPKPRKIMLRLLLIIFVPSIVVYHGLNSWARFNMFRPVLSQESVLPLAHSLSLNTMFKDLGFEPVETIDRFEAKTLNYPLSEITYTDPGGLNIVVIMIDSWRFDAFFPEATPNIYNFSQSAVVAESHNANANQTRHGVYTFFYGIAGAYWEATLASGISPVFMDTLQDQDYEFGIYGSSTLTSPEFDKTVFIKFNDYDRFTEGQNGAEKDLVITNKFLNFLDERDVGKPFFTFLFYDSSHSYRYDSTISPPLFLPEKQPDYINPDADWGPTRNLYLNCVHYVDVLVGRALDALAEHQLLDNTIVIITGDHGEEFNDLKMNFSGHNSNFSPYQVHVPFIIYWPGKKPGQITYPTSHMDVVPTLMAHALGVNTPAEDYSLGVDMFIPERKNYIYMRGPSGGYGIQIGDTVHSFPAVGPYYSVYAKDYQPSNEKLDIQIYQTVLNELKRFRK